jgi:DNA-binding Lrp family transcriptional regulator
MNPLDRIDRAIVAALQNDGRTSNKELAAMVGLAPSSCHERVRRLRERGVLLGVHADVAPRALGIGLEVMVSLRLRQHDREAKRALMRKLQQRDDVMAAYHVSGADDFLVHIVVRDADHLREVVVDELASHQEIGHIQTALIFESVRRTSLPDLLEPST